MRVFIRLTFLLISVLFLSGLAQAQKEDVILKAMKDELNRNMTELQVPNLDKPFFMMYGMVDQKNYSISAMLGSLTESTEAPMRLKSTTRILVGDYDFNDESLEDNLFSSGTAIEIQLPLDDDYLGVRRAFWSTTDKVYRDAARHFDRHKQSLKEKQKELKDVPHRTFAKGNPVTYIEEAPPVTFNKAEWETKVRNLSAIFVKHPYILNSTVAIQFTTGYNYLVNSEGTIVKSANSITTFVAAAQSKNEKGQFAVQQIVHLVASPDQLPTEQQLASEIENLIAAMESKVETPKLEEEYTGPVLIIGPSVADVFSSLLFRSKENIFANDNIAKLTGFQYDEGVSSMDGKIGKTIYSNLLTIVAKPKLKSFNGTQLLGSYQVDDEGIEPAQELLVVEKGVLKALLNNRTITHPSQTANGFSSGPGVLEIQIAQNDSEKTLKEKLIARAKSEGLDFAMIVRESPGYNMGIMKMYRVSVADGKEELVSSGFLNSNPKALKRILGASEKYKAYNVGAVGGRGAGAGPGTGVTSFIVPEAVLLEEMEIRPFNMPSLKEEEYVSNPLKNQ